MVHVENITQQYPETNSLNKRMKNGVHAETRRSRRELRKDRETVPLAVLRVLRVSA
jgi:hypothetical protein